MSWMRFLPFLLVPLLGGCSSIHQSAAASPSAPATPTATDTVVVLLNGAASLDANPSASPAPVRAGDRVPLGASLRIEPGSAALLRLPGGSTVELGGPSRPATVGGTALQSSFRLVGATPSPTLSLRLALFGHAKIVDVVGADLTVYAGVAVVRAGGDTRFTVIAVNESHGDVTVSVAKGSVTAINTESRGGPQVVSAGQEVLLRAPRGH